VQVCRVLTAGVIWPSGDRARPQQPGNRKSHCNLPDRQTQALNSLPGSGATLPEGADAKGRVQHGTGDHPRVKNTHYTEHAPQQWATRSLWPHIVDRRRRQVGDECPRRSPRSPANYRRSPMASRCLADRCAAICRLPDRRRKPTTQNISVSGSVQPEGLPWAR